MITQVPPRPASTCSIKRCQIARFDEIPNGNPGYRNRPLWVLIIHSFLTPPLKPCFPWRHTPSYHLQCWDRELFRLNSWVDCAFTITAYTYSPVSFRNTNNGRGLVAHFCRLENPTIFHAFHFFFHSGTKGVGYWAWPLKYWRCIFL